MQCYTQRVAAPVAVAVRADRQVSDLVYQGMTIAVMFWLLISLWVF